MNKHREVWSEENFKAIRSSGLKRGDFEGESRNWSDIGDTVVFVVCLLIAVWLMFGGV